jgi:cytochrome b-561
MYNVSQTLQGIDDTVLLFENFTTTAFSNAVVQQLSQFLSSDLASSVSVSEREAQRVVASGLPVNGSQNGLDVANKPIKFVIVYDLSIIQRSTPYITVENVTTALSSTYHNDTFNKQLLAQLKSASPSAFRNLTGISLTSTPALKSVLYQMSPTNITLAPPKTSNKSTPSKKSLGSKNAVIVGVVCGMGGCLLVVTTLLLIFYRDPANTVVQDKSNSAATSFAIALGVVCVALVSAWARIATTFKRIDAGFLGEPSWATNVFAWHPLLAVAGFFFSQVLAIASWSVMPTHSSAKAMHVFWQTAAMATMIAGLMAIAKYKELYLENSLVTMHSWLSVGAVSLFGTNYLLGLFMGILTACMSESPLRKMFPLSKFHKVLGMTAFGFTVLSICTGIMDQTGRSGCSYVNVLITTVEKTPALNYPSIPNQCKIANGLGIAVPLCAAAVMLTVYLREPALVDKTVAPKSDSPVELYHIYDSSSPAPKMQANPSFDA